MTDPILSTEIAKKLTLRQQEAFMWLPTDGSGRLLQYTTGPDDLVPLGIAMVSMLLDDRLSYARTALACRVRAAMMEAKDE